MSRSAILSVRVVGDAKGGNKALEQTETRVQKFERGLGKATKVAAIAGAGVIAFGKSLESAGEAAGTANARVDQVLSNLGGFGANHDKVVQRVVKNAEKMARASGIDPNEIKEGQALLGTFESIAQTADKVGGTFDRASQAAVDMSASGFGSVQSASQMLGKALEDPVRGATALRRVGVMLTKEQEEQVKAFTEAGDAAKAQEVVLNAVERQVGGVAEATADASAQMAVSWQLTREEMGQKLAPTFEKVRAAGIKLAEFVSQHSDAVLIAVGVIGALSAAVLTINAAYKAYRAVMVVATAAQWALNIALSANPIGLVVLAIAALVAGFVLAYKKSETFRSIVQAVGRGASAAIGWVVDRVSSLVGWVRDRAPGAFRTMSNTAKRYLNMVTTPIRTIISLVQSVIGWVKRIKWPSPPGWMKKAGGFVGGLFGGFTPPGEGPRPPGPPFGPAGGGVAYRPAHYTAPGTLHAATPSTAVAAAGGRRAGSGQYIQIVVHGAIDPVETADRIKKVLRRGDLRSGETTA